MILIIFDFSANILLLTLSGEMKNRRSELKKKIERPALCSLLPVVKLLPAISKGIVCPPNRLANERLPAELAEQIRSRAGKAIWGASSAWEYIN